MIATKPPESCSICGKPATLFTTQIADTVDSAGELQHGPENVFHKKFYCKEHLPRLHGEPLEDRIE